MTMKTPFASIEYLEEQKAKLKILLQSLENIQEMVFLDSFQIVIKKDSGLVSCLVNKETHVYTDYTTVARFIGETLSSGESKIQCNVAFDLFDNLAIKIQPAWMDKHNRLARGEGNDD